MAKFEFFEWLIGFFESNEDFLFEWDEGNFSKSRLKHNVETYQIESCFYDERILILGIQIEPKHLEPRYGIIAKDSEGKILFVCFTIRNGKIRPISGRVANKWERDIYEA